MSTKITPTAAHLLDANNIIVEHEQKSAQVPHSSILAYCIAQLIAESEARAVEAYKLAAVNEHKARVSEVEEMNQLRAEVERLRPYVSKAVLTKDGTLLCSPVVGTKFNEAIDRAERAEAELANERARFVRFITLADTWETQINDTQRVIENPDAQRRAGVLEINRLRTVNDVRRDMLKDLLNTTTEDGK